MFLPFLSASKTGGYAPLLAKKAKINAGDTRSTEAPACSPDISRHSNGKIRNEKFRRANDGSFAENEPKRPSHASQHPSCSSNGGKEEIRN